MNWNELVKQLGQTLLDSDEFKAYQEAKRSFETDETARILNREMDERQETIRLYMESGREIDNEQLEALKYELDRVLVKMNQHDITRDYYANKAIWQNLARQVKNELDLTLSDDECNSSSGCGGCGGCGRKKGGRQ